MADEISTEVTRRAFEKSGITLTQLAHNLGTDGTTAKRLLGQGSQKRDTVRYEQAVEVIEACHYDPVDFDL